VRALELIDRVTDGHDLDAVEQSTSNPVVLASARGLLGAFPDVRAGEAWVVAEGDMVVAEGDMVVAFHPRRGTHQVHGCSSTSPSANRRHRNAEGICVVDTV
jgi:hypothetical protein